MGSLVTRPGIAPKAVVVKTKTTHKGMAEGMIDHNRWPRDQHQLQAMCATGVASQVTLLENAQIKRKWAIPDTDNHRKHSQIINIRGDNNILAMMVLEK